jgi:23S rRNA pseudouridine2605 synthase
VRLAKHLAHAGIASRRASEQLIFDGRVTIDGQVVTDPARAVTGAENIVVDGKPVRTHDGRRAVYAVNKPKGVVSTAHDTHGRPTVVELVPSGRRLYPVGRLDAETTGLILLTDDGDLAYQLTHPRFEVPKTYVAKVRGGALREHELAQLRDGIDLDDGPAAPARVKRLAHDELELTIREGRKRQVRRMCEAIGHPVAALRRISFGNLRLGSLAEGESRRLSDAEVEKLRKAAAGAVTTSAMRSALGGGGGGPARGGGGGGGRRRPEAKPVTRPPGPRQKGRRR